MNGRRKRRTVETKEAWTQTDAQAGQLGSDIGKEKIESEVKKKEFLLLPGPTSFGFPLPTSFHTGGDRNEKKEESKNTSQRGQAAVSDERHDILINIEVTNSEEQRLDQMVQSVMGIEEASQRIMKIAYDRGIDLFETDDDLLNQVFRARKVRAGLVRDDTLAWIEANLEHDVARYNVGYCPGKIVMLGELLHCAVAHSNYGLVQSLLKYLVKRLANERGIPDLQRRDSMKSSVDSNALASGVPVDTLHNPLSWSAQVVKNNEDTHPLIFCLVERYVSEFSEFQGNVCSLAAHMVDSTLLRILIRYTHNFTFPMAVERLCLLAQNDENVDAVRSLFDMVGDAETINTILKTPSVICVPDKKAYEIASAYDSIQTMKLLDKFVLPRKVEISAASANQLALRA